MEVLKILVWALVSMISFDLICFLINYETKTSRNMQNGEVVTGVEFEAISQWLIGGLCVLSLFLLRLIFVRTLPRSCDSVSKRSEVDRRYEDFGIRTPETTVRKKESITSQNTLSEITFNSFVDDSVCDVPSQLSPCQLQVLLEELKFNMDEKFDEIDSRIGSNERGTKIWSKRLERIETELSYIRHQIFILMSCSAKQNSTLCVGDPPDTKQHTETLKELSTILAQVKKQYNENESKEEVVIQQENPQENSSLKTEQFESKKYSENCLEELERIDKQLNKTMFSDLHIEHDMNDDNRNISDKENSEYAVEIRALEPYSNNIGFSSERYTKDSDVLTKDNDTYLNDFNSEKINNLKIEPDNYSILTDDIYVKSQTTFDNSNLTMIKNFDDFDSKSNIKKLLYSSNKVNEKGDSSNVIVDDQRNSTYFSINSLIEDQSMNLLESSELRMVESGINDGERSRSLSPKRSVRFAQSRDKSPSKSPSWLNINEDGSPIKVYEKGEATASDSKVSNSYPIKALNNCREISYPGPGKRISRRTILERELTVLERSVSPSPTRNKSHLKNVRSKVGDYIRGNKKQIYEKNN